MAFLGADIGLSAPLPAQQLPPAVPAPDTNSPPISPSPTNAATASPPAPGVDDIYGPNPAIALPEAPPDSDMGETPGGGRPDHNGMLPPDRDATAGQVVPPPTIPPPRSDLLPFEVDSVTNPFFESVENRRQDAERLDQPNVPGFSTPLDLPDLAILPAIHLDPLTLAFGLVYQALYDNNILLSEKDKLSDFEHIVVPRVTLSLGDTLTKQANYLAVGYDPQILFFQHYDEFDTVEQDLRLDGQYMLTRTTVKESLRYNDSSDPDRELQGRLSRTVLANETDVIYQASDRFTYELDGTALVRNYAQEIDSTEGRLRFWTRYTADPNLTVSVGATGGEVVVQKGDSQPIQQLLLAAQANFGLGLSASASLGGDVREPEHASEVLATPIFTAALTYQPSSETQFQFLADRQVFSSPDFIDQNYVRTKVSLKASQRIWQTYQVLAEIGYENADYYQFGGRFAGVRSDNYPTAKVEFDYARYKDVDAGVYYRIRRNFSSYPDLSFSDQQVGMQFRIGY